MSDRVETKFSVVVQWSDRSPHSPTYTGQLPIAAIVPGGQKVDIDMDDIQGRAWNRNVPLGGWVKMGRGVSCKERDGGDDGSRSYGQSWANVRILAPEGTQFIFEQGCDSCGDKLGEIKESELVHGRMPKVVCGDCQQVQAEMERLMEGSARKNGNIIRCKRIDDDNARLSQHP